MGLETEDKRTVRHRLNLRHMEGRVNTEGTG
jgi:hypothetical protein